MKPITLFIAIFIPIIIIVSIEIAIGIALSNKEIKDKNVTFKLDTGEILTCNVAKNRDDCSCGNMTYNQVVFTNNLELSASNVEGECKKYFEFLYRSYTRNADKILFYIFYNMAFVPILVIYIAKLICKYIKEREYTVTPTKILYL